MLERGKVFIEFKNCRCNLSSGFNAILTMAMYLEGFAIESTYLSKISRTTVPEVYLFSIC